MTNWMCYVLIETGYASQYEDGEYAFYHADVKGDYRNIGSWDATYAGKYQLGVF